MASKTSSRKAFSLWEAGWLRRATEPQHQSWAQAEEDGSSSDVIEEPHKLVPDRKSNDAPSNLKRHEGDGVIPKGY